MDKKEEDIRFGKFGTVSFTKTTLVNEFISHLEQGKIMSTFCRSCDSSFFPPRADCPECLTREMEWRQVKGKGRLVSYSLLKYAPAGFEEDLPYTIALLDYGQFKVFGRLDKSLDINEVKIGMDLYPAVNQLPGGRLNYIFKKE